MRKYQESLLKNGLRVITSTKKESKVTEIQIWLKSGGRYENDVTWGYSHILEHMLLKGTKKYSDVFSIHNKVDRVGGYFNAITGVDNMRFITQFAGDYEEEFMELLSQIVREPVLNLVALGNEKEVILEEFNQFMNNVEPRAYRLNLHHALSGHPLSRYALGTEQNIKKAGVDELRSYHEKFFQPNRVCVVFIGSLNHKEIKKITEKYFGDWKSSEKITENIQKFSSPVGRSFYDKFQSQQTAVLLNYFTPGINNSREVAALDLVANFLGYGFSSPLKQNLRVKRGLVYNIFCNNNTYHEVGLFTINALTTRPKEFLVHLKEIMVNVGSILSSDILPIVKAQIIGSFLRVNNDLANEARFLGWRANVCDRLVTPDEYINEINSVSYNDIQNVISKYLVDGNSFLTVVGKEDITKN